MINEVFKKIKNILMIDITKFKCDECIDYTIVYDEFIVKEEYRNLISSKSFFIKIKYFLIIPSVITAFISIVGIGFTKAVEEQNVIFLNLMVYELVVLGLFSYFILRVVISKYKILSKIKYHLASIINEEFHTGRVL